MTSEPDSPTRRRFKIRAAPLGLCLFAIAACSSPNRGWWQGRFEGDVTGTMEFSINSRGTKAEGKVTGNLSSGESFRAEFEGTLKRGYLDADMVGSSETDSGLPAGFVGFLSGDLEEGEADGSWQADLRHVRRRFQGRWQASQDLTREE